MKGLQRLARRLTDWSLRWVPDSWIIAVGLTWIVFILAWILTDHGLIQLIDDWGRGFWILHTFAMQMCLIILTGYILSVSPPFRKSLDRLAQIRPHPPRQFASLLLFRRVPGGFTWGLSLIGSAVLARAIARRVRNVDYPLLVCCAYLGLGGTWHAGLSGSVPLLVATPGHFMEQEMGILPVTATIFAPFSLTMVALVLIIWTILAVRMHPAPDAVISVDPALLREPSASASQPRERTFAAWIAHTPWVNGIIGTMGLIWVVRHFARYGMRGLNLDTLNFTFLFLGILLHRTPASFLQATREGIVNIWGVVLQFPFYAGMFGIIRDSGLSEVIAGWFSRWMDASSYPMWIAWYSGIVNYFVPSGGSKWAIEAPYLVEAARTLGVPMRTVVLSYAWGDMLTNVIQPFWAIPLLAVARLEFRHIMGYALVFFGAFTVIVTIGMWVL